MNQEDATLYMKRCVDSGLWVPDASVIDKNSAGDYDKTQEENIYSEINSS